MKVSGRLPIALLGLLPSLVGCGEMIVDSGVRNTPRANFEAFWGEFDVLYAFFAEKSVDWTDVYRTYGSQVDESTSERELLDIFAEMIRSLDDGHVFLRAGDTLIFSASEARRTRPSGFSRQAVTDHYLSSGFEVVGNGRILFGPVTDGIGYVHIRNWEDKGGMFSAVGPWAHDFDRVLEEFQNTQGLIIDVRDNRGGSYFNARFVAGRFTDSRQLATHSQFRNGPGHDDFSELEEWYVEPRGPWTYTRPVVILTNGHTASAAEWFTLAMRELPQVTLVGSSTSGSLGSRIRRELPNGWIYGLPVQRLYSADLQILEERGIDPEVSVEVPLEIGRIDPTLEAAIGLLSNEQ